MKVLKRIADWFDSLDKQKIEISIDKYVSFLLLNFVVGLLPFLLHWVIDGSIGHESFASFLTFGFTFLVSSLYIFKSYMKSVSLGDMQFIGSALIALFTILTYLLFVLQKPKYLYCYFIDNQPKIFVIWLLFLVMLSVLLNNKSIQSEINEKYAEKKLGRQTTNHTDYKKQLNNDELQEN